MFQPNATNGTDTIITSDAPDNNYGTGAIISLNNDYRSLINWNFTCDSLPVGSIITNVIMQVYVTEIQSSADNPRGYHALLVVGYEDYGWICLNSWGKSWGRSGLCCIPYDYEIADKWVIEIN